MRSGLHFIKNNFFLLGTTAFPGFHKLALLMLIGFLFAKGTTADFVNDVFIVYIFGFITAFNWANFILTEMPKLPQKKQALFFGKIVWLTFPLIAPILVISLFLYQLGLIVNFSGFIVYLFCWSFHQLWRHYYIARKHYRALFLSDLLIFAFSLGSIFTAWHLDNSMLLWLSLPCVLIPIFFRFFSNNTPVYHYEFRSIKKFDGKVYARAMNYSLINLSTGGIQLIFAPLSYQLLNAEFAMIVGYTNNFASIALLIPRAIAYNFIPELSQNFRFSFNLFSETLHRFQKRINLSLIVLLIIGALVFALFYVIVPNFDLNTIFLALSIYINLLTAQLSLPASNALIVMFKNQLLLKVNVLFLILFLLISAGMYLLIENSLLFVFSCTTINILTNYFRYRQLNYHNTPKYA